MSTRSAIIIENADGTAEGIYCHFDGYPEHHGPILLGHYLNEESARNLVALGDISSLAEDIGEKHDFNRCPDNVVNAYGRDRGETDVESKAGKSWREVASGIGHNGHVYVYRVRKDGGWYYSSGSSELVRLADVAEVKALVPQQPHPAAVS
jgi:hypothetical protein